MSVQAIAERHGLELVRSLPRGYGTLWIAEVESPEHGRCVLKAVREQPDNPGDEIGALRAWTEAGARLPARLLAELEPGLALIEWIDGGLVAERGGLAPEEARAIGADLRDLHLPRGGGTVLLHADLNAHNLIVSPAGIRCIDPLGFVGDPVQDLVFLAAANPAADRSATFMAACEGYGIDPLTHEGAFVEGLRGWVKHIGRRGAERLHPVGDVIELLERMRGETYPQIRRRSLLRAVEGCARVLVVGDSARAAGIVALDPELIRPGDEGSAADGATEVLAAGLDGASLTEAAAAAERAGCERVWALHAVPRQANGAPGGDLVRHAADVAAEHEFTVLETRRLLWVGAGAAASPPISAEERVARATRELLLTLAPPAASASAPEPDEREEDLSHA